MSASEAQKLYNRIVVLEEALAHSRETMTFCRDKISRWAKVVRIGKNSEDEVNARFRTLCQKAETLEWTCELTEDRIQYLNTKLNNLLARNFESVDILQVADALDVAAQLTSNKL